MPQARRSQNSESACLETGGTLKSQEWWFVGDRVARRRGRPSWMISLSSRCCLTFELMPR